MAVTTTRRAIVRVRGAERAGTPDELAVEAPLTLTLDDTVQSVLMRTPGHDVELAAGWLLVESGVRSAADIWQLRACREADADSVHATLRPGVQPPRPRAYLTSAACGVCSADLIELVPQPPAAPATPDWTIDAGVLAGLPDTMRAEQRAFSRTGGLHAAALARGDGTLLVVREDIGRHNAVDKVTGWALFENRLPLTNHLLVVSGRVSFEIVQKAVGAGVAGIVAVSAPSSLAVDLCRRYDLLLAGLVRDGRLNAYAGADRIRS